MGEEFKNTLDTFIKDIILKIPDKSILGEMENKYNDLTEQYYKLTVLSKEEFESLDNDMTNYENLIKEKDQNIEDLNNQLSTQKKEYEDKINLFLQDIKRNEQYGYENQQLKTKYTELENKYRACNNDNIQLSIQVKDDEVKITKLENENKKIKKENFEKFENLNELQRDSKLKERTIEELTQKLTKISSSTSELEKKNKELTTELTSKKIYYENQIIILKKQIDQLSNSNYTLTKENNEIQNQLKDFQIYTSMVKVKKTKIEEKDFSIIEIMSQRAEKAEYDNLLLKNINDELKNEIAELKKKIEPMENITLLHVKNDISDNGESNKNDFSQDDIYEIEKIKNEPKELLDMIFKLKNENIYLHNELKNITIECNQRLRDRSKKTD
jgi:chromosome segregation ATPase